MKRISLEFVVGLFVLAGLLSFAYLAIKLSGANVFGENTYTVNARFGSVSGLREGAVVELAGVSIGKVARNDLDAGEYEAVVQLTIADGVRIQEDSIASIRSTGIIGDKFVKISPGGLEEYIEPGGDIIETESSVSLEELLSKYIFQGE